MRDVIEKNYKNNDGKTNTHRHIDRVEVSESNHCVRKVRKVEGVVEAETLEMVFYFPDPVLSLASSGPVSQ